MRRGAHAAGTDGDERLEDRGPSARGFIEQASLELHERGGECRVSEARTQRRGGVQRRDRLVHAAEPRGHDAQPIPRVGVARGGVHDLRYSVMASANARVASNHAAWR